MTGCEVPDCSRERYYRQRFCKPHYQRWTRHGDPTAGNRSPGANRCAVEGCDRPYANSGYCNTHRLRLQRTGDPLGVRRATAEQRLWSRIDRGGPGECWLWTGGVNGHGYGRLAWEGRKNARAHRVVYTLINGTISEDQEVRHTCDNPPCCNPAHLVPGEHAENMDDMVRRGRRSRRFTDDQLEAVRTDPRQEREIAEAYGMSRSYVHLIRTQYRRGMNRSFTA